MIKSFKYRALRDYWTKGDAAGINQEWLKKVTLILSAMDMAGKPQMLDVPGLGFHALRGDRKGEYAVSVSGNWRITFGWSGEDAINVRLEDYHGR